MQKHLFQHLSTLLALLALTGCVLPTPPAPTPPTMGTPDATEESAPPAGDTTTLANTYWQLVSFGPTGSETPVSEGTMITLAFDANGQASGESGCNKYGGSYQVQGDTLVFGEMVSTLMACVDEQVMQQEEEYLQALQSAGHFEVAADHLTIWYDEGRMLNFVPSTEPTPTASSESSTGSSGSGLPATLSSTEPPEQVGFDPGATSTERTGLLPSGPGIKQFVLTANAGQTMTIDATSDGTPLSMTIESPSDNQWIPEMQTPADGFTIGQQLTLPETGDYLVTLTKGDHTPSTNYTITFTVQVSA